MPFATQGVALTVTVQATLRSGNADPTAAAINLAVRKWKQGEGEDGYYYTGSAWQVGAAVVASTQGDFHAHTAVVDATRMASLQGWDIEARPADAGAIGPASWYHVGLGPLGDVLAAILADTVAIDAKTTNLPSDPADQSLLVAEHDATQVLIAALNNLAQSDILDDATPFSGADIAAILTDTDEIQGKLPSGDICGEPIGSRAIVIHTQEADTTIIPQAAVSIWTDAIHTNLVTRVTTDASGDFGVDLDDATYYYTGVKNLYTFTAGSFVVSADATHNITGVSVAPASPSSPSVCVIYGTVLDASGDPVASKSVAVQVVVPASSSGNQLSRKSVSTTTDAFGYFEIELVRESVVVLTIGTVGLSGRYTVPDAANQDITTWEAD